MLYPNTLTELALQFGFRHRKQLLDLGDRQASGLSELGRRLAAQKLPQEFPTWRRHPAQGTGEDLPNGGFRRLCQVLSAPSYGSVPLDHHVLPQSSRNSRSCIRDLFGVFDAALKRNLGPVLR